MYFTSEQVRRFQAEPHSPILVFCTGGRKHMTRSTWNVKATVREDVRKAEYAFAGSGLK